MKRDERRSFLFSSILPGSEAHTRSLARPSPAPSYLVNASTAQIDNHTARFGPDVPWFVHLSFVSPHPPSTPPAPWDRAFGPAAMPPLDYAPGDIDALPHQTRMLLGLLGDASRAYAGWLLPDGAPNMTAIDAERTLYYGLCGYVDAQVQI